MRKWLALLGSGAGGIIRAYLLGEHSMSRNGAATVKKSKQKEPRADFCYGWRYVRRVGSRGKVILDEVPLTLEDVLHPQQDDHVPERPTHCRDRVYLADVLRSRLAGLRRARLFSNCLIDWGVPGLRNHCPDIAVFENVPDLERCWYIFPVRPQGATPLLAIEIAVPPTRHLDAEIKVEHYHRARVPLYLIVDWEAEDRPRTLVGYRWTRRRYVRLRPDRQGRLPLKPFGIQLGLEDDNMVCHTAERDEIIPNYEQLTERLEAIRAARRIAETQRRATETRIRELEEEVRRLRGQNHTTR